MSMSGWRALLLSCGVGIFSAIFSQNSFAGLFDDEEARAQIAQLRNQVRTQQQQVEVRITELESLAKSRSMIDLFNQLEVLKVEVAKLRGMQEVMNNEIENAQKRQRDLYQDADSRIRKMETGMTALEAQNKAMAQVLDQFKGDLNKLTAAQQTAAQPVAPAQPPAPTPEVTATTVATNDSISEQRAFDAALTEFRAARFREATAGFTGFTRNYPRSSLVPAAQYWLGNSLFAAKDFRGSINAHRQLLAQYPESNRAPDAMLSIGNAFAELDDSKEARRMWQDVVKQHPSTDAAARARSRLAR
jgi:tol-pal system protein YbgF